MKSSLLLLALLSMLFAPWSREAPARPDTDEQLSTAITSSEPAPPIRAMSLDLADLAQSPDDLDRLEQRMQDAGINMVGVSAGRLDWTGFRWIGWEERWSARVRENDRDLLAEATQRFGHWAHVSAIVDVFAPRYLQTRPLLRALDAAGRPIAHHASTHALVNGPFGDELIVMIDYIARHYEVDSIALTELFYYQEGYGPDDLALYQAHSRRRDWPRTPHGAIDVDHPTIGAWRSVMIARFVERAARVAHAHGKQLFVDVRVDWRTPGNEGRRSGHDYALLLRHADRLALWNYFGLNGAPPEYTRNLARYAQQYGTDRIIISYGLWARRGAVVSAEDLQRAMIAGRDGHLPHAWITPVRLMSDDHWRALSAVWHHTAQKPISSCGV